MTALVTAADDFARPLVAAQRAALDAAVAAVGSNPPASFEEARSEFEAELRELEAALASALSEEREAITALAAAARADANADEAAVAARFDPARAALGERLRERRARTPKPPSPRSRPSAQTSPAPPSPTPAPTPPALTPPSKIGPRTTTMRTRSPRSPPWDGPKTTKMSYPPWTPRGQTSPRRPRPRDRLPSPSNPATIPPTLPAEVSFRA